MVPSKKLLIDGKWVAAASGKTFETFNPATGELLASVAEGDAEDINRRGGRGAPRLRRDHGARSSRSNGRRCCCKLADLVEKNFEELSQLDTLDMGAPIGRTRGNKLRVLGMLRYYAGQATALHGETIENSLPGDIFSYTLEGARRRRRRHHSMERAARRQYLEDRPRDRDRLHRDSQASRRSAVDLATTGRIGAWRPAFPPGVANVVTGLWRDRGCRAGSRIPDVDKVAFTGSHVTGSVDHPRLRRQPQASLARTRRKIARHCVR